jgi:hypothetical protein
VLSLCQRLASPTARSCTDSTTHTACHDPPVHNGFHRGDHIATSRYARHVGSGRNQIVGGASGGLGTLSATWPLAVLTFTDTGVSVDMRSRWMKRALRGWIILSEQSPVWLSVRWEDIASVLCSRHSVVLRPKRQPGCRFVTVTRRRLEPLIDELERHDIPVTRVGSTLGWFFKPS